MDNKTNQEDSVKISSSFRYLENGHILLWLIKDTCWAMTWRAGGMFMIAPTVGMAFYILWKTRHNRTDLFHNIAICFWICANTTWMTGEFFKMELKPLILTFFGAGLAVLAVYYLFFFAADRRKEKSGNVTVP